MWALWCLDNMGKLGTPRKKPTQRHTQFLKISTAKNIATALLLQGFVDFL